MFIAFFKYMYKKTESYWIATTPKTTYSILRGKKEVDVAIIGAGITGLTTALLLKQAGKKVAVIEQHQVAAGESGHTTAHLTEIIDTRFDSLISKFGRENTRLVVDSSRAALSQIAKLIRQFKIDCEFLKVPAYLYTEDIQKKEELERELKALQQLDIRAEWIKKPPLPYPTAGGIKIYDQAQFHPRKYLLAIAQLIPGNGSYIFERTAALDFKEKDPCCVKTNQGEIQAKAIVFATNTPSANRYLMHTKIAAYRTYAIAVDLNQTPSKPALFWDTCDPYHYIRCANDLWIIGGADHKTGTVENTEQAFNHLIEFAQSHFSVKNVSYRWSGQIMEPVDSLPYIGLNPTSENLFIATGFTGNGMTFGTLSGMIISDLILWRTNRWAHLYSPKRIKLLDSAKTYIKENKDFPIHLIQDRLSPPEKTCLSEIKSGEGNIIQINGKKAAIYKDAQGNIHALSPNCTHLGCQVQWNQAEKSWDCPCHGSRFEPNGKVLNGPAMKQLELFHISKNELLAAKKKKAA